MASGAPHHGAYPSYSSMAELDPRKDTTAVQEIPLHDINLEKTTITTTSTVPIRRSTELSRPKKQIKPRPFDRFVTACGEQSIVVKGFLIALVTAIPFLIFVLVAYVAFEPQHLIGPKQLRTTMRRLADWLLLCWGSFIGLLYVGRIVAMGVAWLCSLSSEANKFRGLAREACLRLTLFLWAAVGYAVVPQIFSVTAHEQNNASANADLIKAVNDWVAKLHRAFMFLMIAFAIILVQGILLMLIKIQYIEGFIGPRAEKAAAELEVMKDLNNLVNPHVRSDDIGIISRALKKLLLPINSKDHYYLISRGEGNQQVWDDYAAKVWQMIARGKTHLTLADVTAQLRVMNRPEERGVELFRQLDQSSDDAVTEDEVTKLVGRIGLQLNRRTQAMNGIRRLMQKLEIVLSVLVLGLIVFLYVQFFEKDLAKNIGNLWTGIVGLAFAFSGAVSEFVNSCVFCFGKHAYDVGDFVEVKGKKYIVNTIFLTHTNFEAVQNEHVRGLFTQMSHASLATEPIVNWTRTCEEAVERHHASDDAAGKKSGDREDTAAALVAQKLEHLQAMSGKDVKQE